MIIVKNLKTDYEFKVTPTIFPDGTSQVWKLPLEKLEGDCLIIWHFEQEAELINLCQLISLLDNVPGIRYSSVYVPYLPYGRQDKPVSNNSTFALGTFLDLLPDWIYWETLDAHSDMATMVFTNHSANRYILKALKDSDANVLVFPDKGAKDRYSYNLGVSEYIVFRKERDPLTGQILSQTIDKSASKYRILSGQRLLIVDDICDGGWTFISAAKLLREMEPESIDLYVTHGIFSKGRQVLHDAGIRNIYTTKSLIKNTDGYDLEEII